MSKKGFVYKVLTSFLKCCFFEEEGKKVNDGRREKRRESFLVTNVQTQLLLDIIDILRSYANENSHWDQSVINKLFSLKDSKRPSDGISKQSIFGGFKAPPGLAEENTGRNTMEI